jgi:hypothetical protein
MADIVRFQTSSAEPYPLSVSGESNYKHNISDVTGYMDEDDGVDVDDLRAQLILEDDNSYDANAVCIKIDDKTVGYLSRFDAKRYRQRLSGMGLTDAIGECWASVRGGFIKKDGSFADFGVRLDIDLDNLQIENKDQVMVPTSTPKPVQPPSPPIIQPAIKTGMPATKKKNKVNIWVALISICVLCVCLAVLMDRVSFVLENAGWRSTRTPRSTATEYINFSTAIALTQIAEPTYTPIP